MEHKVYVCSWSRSPAGFALWVKGRPKLRGEGATCDEAEEQLIEAIQDAGGAMTAVLEFDRPLPRTPLAEKYTSPELLLVVGDAGFHVDGPRATPFETKEEMLARQRWAAEYYDAPICSKCQYVKGQRSEKPLTVSGMEKGYDGAFGHIGFVRTTHQLLREEFQGLLSPRERAQLELRPVHYTGRRKFFELVGPAGPPVVAVAGMKASGWRCETCDYRLWGYWSDELQIQDCERVYRRRLPGDQARGYVSAVETDGRTQRDAWVHE